MIKIYVQISTQRIGNEIMREAVMTSYRRRIAENRRESNDKARETETK